MDKELHRIITCYPSLRGRLRRNRSSGCLEYIGSGHGSSQSNPLVPYINSRGRNSTMTLRRWIWLSHGKKIPSGKYLIMSCGNVHCMDFQHEYLGAHPARYQLVNPETCRLLTPEIVKTIRFYKGKVLPKMLSRVLPRISAYRIRKVLNYKTFPEITVPKGYRPPKQLVEILEELSSRRSRYRIYLGPITLRSALHDISQSLLTLREKRILRQYVQQVPVENIGSREGVSRTRIYNVIGTSRIKIAKVYGHKRWFILFSKKSKAVIMT